jgi:hypothetical protein
VQHPSFDPDGGSQQSSGSTKRDCDEYPQSTEDIHAKSSHQRISPDASYE